MNKEDFLVEILTEELPPKALRSLAETFCQQMKAGLLKENLGFEDITFFATPRRLSVLVINLDATQPDQEILRKGPARAAAYDANGHPSKACLGFARSLGVSADDLITITNTHGEWVGLKQKIAGKSVTEIMPKLVTQALSALPIPKRMRWGEGDTQFVRPVHSVIMLYGDQIIEEAILGAEASRITRGHRFLASDWITIPHASTYVSLLESEGFVIADFDVRRDKIRQAANQVVKNKLGSKGHVLISSEELLDEVTGLVEWPVAICGEFDAEFLNLPEEVLISSMQDHQRYFPVVDQKNKLLPYFVAISNIMSHDDKRVIRGNERVLQARLADAAFFYAMDKKESLDDRIQRLKGIIFQAKLGTLYDKAKRLSELSTAIAERINPEPVRPEEAAKRPSRRVTDATRAGWLAKADLTTQMVNEFPELQGIMGYYYAKGIETDAVALALKEHYMPRFAGDELPQSVIGQVLAIADRLDLLTGIFGIQQIPTGDKDPFGLRRAAVGVLRILIEKEINLDLNTILQLAKANYGALLQNQETVPQILNFMQERLRAWYQDQGVSADVFAAVSSLGFANPLDVDRRIKAVMAFKKLNEAEALSIANKRVSNILDNVDTHQDKNIDPRFFENQAEEELARQLELKSQQVENFCQAGEYEKALLQLAELRKPIDDFFDQVMVMTDDQSRRENRLLLLTKLRALFLQVADIALLQ